LSFRYVPSQADTAVFEALKGAPAAEHAHALRWYNHIKSFGAGMKQFPKAANNAADYASGAAATGGKAAAKEEDDDVDLFGSGG
jgi:elongation factor 1-beta